MHHANHFYGHAEVMARWCGIDRHPVPPIAGYLQHGWNIGDGFAPEMPYAEGSALFVWSEPTRRRAWSLGRRNVVVVGSPWAYLLRLEPGDPAQRVGAIFYPFHGWEGQEVRGDHRRLAREVREIEDGPVTACLYWAEYHMPRIRRVYEDAGFRVITHGYRGYWWRDTDPAFLPRQLAELRKHRRVVSNRLSSAVLYGTLAGCEPAVYGNPMTLKREDTSFGGISRQRRQWPEFHGVRVDAETALASARAELGADQVLPPEAVRQLFGWAA